jgi:hypothetical protein
VSEYSDVVLSAVKDSEGRITQSLRRFVREAGWPIEGAQALRVQSDGTEVFVESSSPTALNLEYGDGENRPSGSVRQFVNRPEESENILIRQVTARLGNRL